MKTVPVRILTASLAVLLMAGFVLAQGKKTSDVVKIEATAASPDAEGNQVVTILVDIEKPWHVYANPVGNDFLTAAQTSVRFLSDVEDAKLTYPEGKLVKDSLTGDYRTYEGKVTIKANVKRQKGDSGPLEFSIKLQACDDKSCLVPATIKKSVP